MYTEYQIRAAFIKTIHEALSHSGITGYKVLVRNPPEMVNETDVVLIDKLSQRRRGFQGRGYWKKYSTTTLADGTIKKEVIEYHKAEQWIEEIQWQVSVIHKKSVTDTINTMTAEDVVKYIVGWMNSADAASYMRHRSDVPFAPCFIRDTRTRAYNDENDIHQQDEQFDFTMCVLQTMDANMKAVDGWVLETYPI